MPRKPGNLRERFITEYLIDVNATQAAIRAGYSPKTAKSQGQRLLTFVDVKTRIDAALAEQTKRAELTAEYIITSLREVAERCKQAEPVLDKKGKPIGEYRFDSTGANKALELLGKHKRLFIDRLEISAPDARKDLEQRIEFGLEGYRRLAKAILAQCCESCREQVPPELTKRDILELMSKTPEMLGELYPIVQQELASEAVQ